MAITRVYNYSQVRGASIKIPCIVATTSNVTLSGLQTIDGVSVVADDRVLVKNQSTASQNGIYDVASGSWARSLDFSTNDDVFQGVVVIINSGNTYSDTMFVLTTPDPITLASTSLTFEQLTTSQYFRVSGFTGNQTLTTANAAFYLRCTDAAPVTVTISPQSATTWADNTEIMFEQAGAGQVRVSAGVGVTLNCAENTRTAQQYSVVAIKRVASDVWTMFGDLEPL